MGVPCMSFMEDEFRWSKKKICMDFWTHYPYFRLTNRFFSLIREFLMNMITGQELSHYLYLQCSNASWFSWIFGLKKGWPEFNRGAELKIPGIYKYITKFITPVLLIIVFLGALFTPKGNNWISAFQQLFSGNRWPLDNGSIIKQISNASLNEQLNQATDLATKAQLQEKLFLINSSRALLLFVFIGVTVLVYKAYHKRKREGRMPI